MQTSRSLKQVIAGLKHTFTSIDIRAVAAKKKRTKEWKCIFLKVRLTLEDRSKILGIYEKKKKDLDLKNHDRFRLLAECKNIRQLNSTIKQIQSGHITIEGFSLKLLQDIKNLYDQSIETRYYNYSTTDEKCDYEHWFVAVSNSRSDGTQKIFQDFELTIDETGIEYNLISEWLDIPERQWEKNFTYLIFAVPIYIKRLDISEKENKFFVNYEISKSLLSKCQLRKIVYQQEQEPKRDEWIPVSSLLSKEGQQQRGIAILKTAIDCQDISEGTIIEIKISHSSLPELYSDMLRYGDLRHFVKKPISPNFIQKLMSEITREFANNSHRNKYQQDDFKADPFEGYINCLFSQLSPCIWIGSFENAGFLKQILRKHNFEDKAVDFILLDNKKNSSTILIECTRQFLSDRSIVGEYECGKLARVKTLLERQHLHNVHAIIVCAEPYNSNPQLHDSVIERFKDIHFLFKEDLESIQGNIDAVSMHEHILRLCRTFKG